MPGTWAHARHANGPARGNASAAPRRTVTATPDRLGQSASSSMSSSWRIQSVSTPTCPCAASRSFSYSNWRSNASSNDRSFPLAAWRGVRPRRAGSCSSSQGFSQRLYEQASQANANDGASSASDQQAADAADDEVVDAEIVDEK